MIKNIRFSIGADNKSKCVSIAKEYLIKNNYPLIEYGSLAGDGLDWVEVAKRVSRDVQQNKSDFGLLFCYTGTGVTIVANKFKGIRASNVTNEDMAIQSVEHNNVNVLCLGTNNVSKADSLKIVLSFLNSEMSNEEKYHRRINKLED